ncbi:MAG: glycosyltransferase family 4 protein [Ferruginibacter sp.]
MNKIKVFHFHNGSGGGVLSVIKNLLRFSTNSSIENHIIYAINDSVNPDYEIEPVEGAVSQQLLYYSANNNFYHTCRQLAKLLPDEKVLVIAHDWLELGMMSNLGLQNPVIQIVHGNYDYYYQLAAKHTSSVDAYICISRKIFDSLTSILPQRNAGIFCYNFPVPPVVSTAKGEGPLQIIYYTANLNDHNKQFSTVLNIAEQLSRKPGKYYFTIAGGGMTTEEFFAQWPTDFKTPVDFTGLLSNENIIRRLPGQHIFLLPSLAEGLPVSLVEAMKAGVVPLVTDWNGGADELIKPGSTGYYFEPGAAVAYADCIQNLSADRKLLQHLSDNCIQTANAMFDPWINTRKFEERFIATAEKQAVKKPAVKIYGTG